MNFLPPPVNPADISINVSPHRSHKTAWTYATKSDPAPVYLAWPNEWLPEGPAALPTGEGPIQLFYEAVVSFALLRIR